MQSEAATSEILQLRVTAFFHDGVPLLLNWFVMQQSPGRTSPFTESCLTYFNYCVEILRTGVFLLLLCWLQTYLHSSASLTYVTRILNRVQDYFYC